jgi:hypothetical protein
MHCSVIRVDGGKRGRMTGILGCVVPGLVAAGGQGRRRLGLGQACGRGLPGKVGAAAAPAVQVRVGGAGAMNGSARSGRRCRLR